ncbi:DMT family transporter [Psychromonas sp. 14N.309.X.WAT.B.A12]|uniref:DMT family transporter n=1 Tax=unclassified Psychromonas TaxID=2614957 RepID=UPI0025B23CC8|nr:DMT family transporter [Psychromonas sp. 14N.309.X.WAT.B.A12]MDN2661973.1 DMT family transporter [Psychromonas sp. 14N.309.X.WAT.B.A12]
MSQLTVSPKASKQGVFAILFSSLLWGTTGTAASYASSISPLAIGSFTMGIGGLLLAINGAKHIRLDINRLLQARYVLLIGAIALAIYPLAFYSAMRLSGVAIGTVVSIASAPFFVAIIERLFSKENNIDGYWLFSLLLGAIGIAFLASTETSVSSSTLDMSNKYLGILLGFVAGFTYALYSWAAKALINRGVSSKSAVGSIFGLGGILLVPVFLLNTNTFIISSVNTMVLLYIAIIPMFIGYLCFGFGLKTIHASKATLLTLFEPAVAAIFAVCVVGESISLLGWFGLFLIMICLLLQSYKS